MTPELLARARAAKGFMPDDEGMALYRAGLLAAASSAGPLLEIGTYCAKSALYLGAAAQESDRVLFSVDHHRGSEEQQPGWDFHDPTLVDPAVGLLDTLPLARATIEQAGLAGAVALVVGPSVTVAKGWETPVALLFIDGGHGREVAWDDYRWWTPRIAPGGLLALHDVFPNPADGGRPPYELYCEALCSGGFEDLADVGCGSLRVLRRRP